MGTITRDVVLSSFVGSFPWPRVDHGEGCRNHKYNALHGWIDLYQSTHSEFRYGDEKVLGTQSHPIRGSASTYFVPSLNLVEGIFNMLF